MRGLKFAFFAHLIFARTRKMVSASKMPPIRMEETWEHQPAWAQKFDLEELDIPDLSQITKAKNEESLLIPADEDNEGREVKWIKMCSCPIRTRDGGKCSKRAWDNAAVWSMVGHLSMFSYLMNHLVGSSNHKMNDVEAYDAILKALGDGAIEVETKSYDWEQRETYRSWEANKVVEPKRGRKSKKRKTEAAASSSVQPPEEAEEEDEDADDDEEIDGEVKLSPQGLKDLIAKSAKAAVKEMSAGMSKVGKADAMGNVKIPLSKLKLFQDAATRAEWAVCNSLIMHATTAKKLEAERQTLASVVADLSEITGEPDKTMSSSSKVKKPQLSLQIT